MLTRKHLKHVNHPYAKVVAGIGAAILIYKAVQQVRRKRAQWENSKKAAQLIQERDAKVYKFTHVDEEKAQVICEMDVTQLRAGMLAGEFTSVEIVTVFAKRCHKYGRELNYSTEENFEFALKQAEECDRQLQLAIKSGTTDRLGRFHGVPFGVKDHIAMKGFRSTCGLSCMTDKVEDSTSPMVSLLMEEGGIPLVRSALPQVGMSYVSKSEISGFVMNPHDNSRTTGGSSAGSAGLVATRSVPVEVGSDIGGSIRYPAHACGIVGFRPTPRRTTMHGFGVEMKDGIPIYSEIDCTYGPLCRSIDDAALVFETWWVKGMQDVDITQPVIPFDRKLYEESQTKKLRVGYMESLSAYPSSAAVRRSLRITRDALAAKGHEIVPFEFSEVEINRQYEVFTKIIMLAVRHIFHYMDDLNNEAPMKELYGDMEWYQKTHPIITNALVLYHRMRGDKRWANFASSLIPINNPTEYEHYQRMRFLETVNILTKWKTANIDVLIMPVNQHCAFKFTNAKVLGLTAQHNMIWNLVNFPAGVIPVTEVLPGEEHFDDGFDDRYTGALADDAKGSAGMPLGV